MPASPDREKYRPVDMGWLLPGFGTAVALGAGMSADPHLLPFALAGAWVGYLCWRRDPGRRNIGALPVAKALAIATALCAAAYGIGWSLGLAYRGAVDVMFG